MPFGQAQEPLHDAHAFDAPCLNDRLGPGRRLAADALGLCQEPGGAVFHGALEHAFHDTDLIVRLPRVERTRRSLRECRRRQRDAENQYTQCLHDVPATSGNSEADS